MQTKSIGGSMYMLLFKNEFSGYRTVYFLKSKDEICGKFKAFITQVKNETGNDVSV